MHGVCEGIDGANEVTIVEVPRVQVEGRWEAADDGLGSECEEEGPQGVALLDALFGGEAGGAVEDRGVGPV